MSAQFVSRPRRRAGLLVNLFAILLLLGAASLGLWRIFSSPSGPELFAYLIPVLLALPLVPLLGYRLYALLTAAYILEREGLRLRWGLRLEDIPITEVQFVERAENFPGRLPRPRLGWPGAVLGTRRMPLADDPTENVVVEFLAASLRGLVLVGTPRRTFAISPGDPAAFIRAFQRTTELGSLAPIPARTVQPTFLLARLWADRLPRWLILVGLGASLLLLAVASLAVSERSQVFLGFKPDGSPGDAVPAIRLFLLPLANSFFVLLDGLLGLFFYRRADGRLLACLLWGVGALLPWLFLAGLAFILRSG